MSYLDKIRSRRTSNAATQHQLRLLVAMLPHGIICVVEGEEDEAFYCHFIESEFDQFHVRPIVCDGKGGVLALRDFYDRHYYDASGVLFFVDLDNDDLIGIDHERNDTYVTTHYSIENYLIDNDLVRTYIRKKFSIRKHDPLLELITINYEKELKEFIYRTKCLMTFIIALRIHNFDHTLREFKLSHYSKTRDRERPRITFVELLNRMECNAEFGLEHYRESSKKLTNLDPIHYMRGKFFSEFLRDYIGRIEIEFRNSKKVSGKNLRLRNQIGKGGVLFEMIEFMPVPERLNEFLGRHS